MSPDEIDRKIKELGLTREEATRKAAELGISLEQYLGSARPVGQPLKPDTLSAQKKAVDTLRIDTTTIKVPAIAPPKVPLSPSGLPYFGYDVFATTPSAFEPAAA